MEYQSQQQEVLATIIAEIATLCAWCLAEQGFPAGEGSHGICKKHADIFLLQRIEQRGKGAK